MTISPGSTGRERPLARKSVLMTSFYLPNPHCLVNIRAPDFPKVDHENV